MNDELQRFENLKKRVETYNTQALDKKLRLEQAEEKRTTLLQDLNNLGYATLEDAEKALQELEPKVIASLEAMEKKMSELENPQTVEGGVLNGTTI